MAFREDKTVVDFYLQHLGETCVVCGLGESLELFTPDYQEQFITIGVNDIIDRKKGFNPHYQVITENGTQIDINRNYRNSSINQKVWYILNTTCDNVFSVHDLPFMHIKPIKLPVVDLREDSIEDAFMLNKIPSYRKVTTTAISLAFWMSFRLIGVIGHDCCGKRWICPSGNKLGMEEGHLELMNHFCQKYADYAEKNGIKFFNLSPISAIESIPKCSLDEFCDMDREGY